VLLSSDAKSSDFSGKTVEKFGIVVYFSCVTLGVFTMATRLGEKIRELRKGKKLTLEALAAQAGLSKSYLWELENRESQRPSAEKLMSLADALGVSQTYLIEDDVQAPEQHHLDEAFYRNYKKLDADAKERLRKILDALKN
jgi:transcriptional regulator with XRE-family HTH domain